MRAELAADSKCVIGEGPVWDGREGKLYFIDVREWKLLCWDGTAVKELVKFAQNIGFAVLRERGGFVAGLRDGFYCVERDGTQRRVAAPEASRTDGRFNDGKVDPAGRVWGGTMPVSLDTGVGPVGPDSGLYCMDGRFQTKTMLRGVIQGNGLAWSADAKKFYFIDTQRFCVQEFHYDLEKNELSNGRVCVEIPQTMGIPDGMTVDDEGNLWVALWGGGGVAKYDPATGRLLDKAELPVLHATSCCFGGTRLDELYITTAGYGTDPARYPFAGGVFRVRPGVTGRPSYLFRG